MVALTDDAELAAEYESAYATYTDKPISDFTCYQCRSPCSGSRVEMIAPMCKEFVSVPEDFWYDDYLAVCSTCWSTWHEKDVNRDNHGLMSIAKNVLLARE